MRISASVMLLGLAVLSGNAWPPAEYSAMAYQQSAVPAAPLPNQPDSFKFVALGDSGTGDKAQYELADQMAALRGRFKYDVVLLLGGNVQGGERPKDFVNKFEAPYKRLLEGGVAFHAVLGDEDSRDRRFYKNFNMNAQPHYAFEPRPGVQFFALESSNLANEQVEWLEAKFKDSKSGWKVVYLHHPLYSSARRHRSGAAPGQRLEPLFLKYNVSVVLGAHENVYERTKPQNGVTYFVVGSGGKVRKGDIDRNSGLSAGSFDTDLAFLAAEIIGDRLYFNAISRTGETVDSGVLTRRE
jgi:hypothetical protein